MRTSHLIWSSVLANGLAWLLAFILFRDNALLFGAAVLAYGLGLKHALDADHIAVIDNVTRAALRENREARAAGLFFSLGHSTVVCLATLTIVLAGQHYRPQMDAFAARCGLLGAWVSVLFLFLVASINAMTLHDLWRRRNAQTEDFSGSAPRGLGRLLAPVFRRVSVSWHLYPVGFLFGLGFDTASEISLLGISVVQGERGLPVWEIMMFPLLFTVGMALLDTADSVLMHGLYRRAGQRMNSNLMLTCISVLLALVIAGIEMVNLLAGHLWALEQLKNFTSLLSAHFEIIGAVVFCASGIGWVLLRPGRDAEMKEARGGI